MRQTTNMPRLMVTTSIVLAAVSLTGCASLQGVWGDIKSGSVTTPDEMSKALYLPEPSQNYETLAEVEDYQELGAPSLITVSYTHLTLPTIYSV